MTLLNLLKPEYIFRPTQIARRLMHRFFTPPGSRRRVRLPWKLELEIESGETIADAVLHLGIFDLAVSEVLFRLTEPGDTTVDVGANIGLMTSLLGVRCGPRGRVLAFEPHPQIAQRLRENAEAWGPRSGVVEVHEIALTDAEGPVSLTLPAGFDRNRGLGKLSSGGSSDEEENIPVRGGTLDAFLGAYERVGVVKIDVEGHEEKLLHGSRATLSSQIVRDWIVEHHDSYPSAVSEIFRRSGYTIFEIRKRFFRPQLEDPRNAPPRSTWESTSFLATREPQRAKEKLSAFGWSCLWN